jgi:predicted DNA-binding protein
VAKGYVKISVKLSGEVNERLEHLSEKLAHGNKSELMRKMIALIDVYERENERNGSELALIKDGEIWARLIL